MLFAVNYKNKSKEQLLKKFDISIKNSGAKIPLPDIKLALTQFLSRVSDLEDLAKRMSSLFSGNSSRLQHLFFDDVALSFDGTSSAKGMVWYGLHTPGAWMIGHNISIEESQGRFVRWSIVRLIL